METLQSLENLRFLADQIMQHNNVRAQYAYAGFEAWSDIIAELSTMTGLPLDSSAGDLHYLGMRVSLDKSLPPGLILVGIESNVQTQIEEATS